MTSRRAIGAGLLLAAWLLAGGVRAGAQQPPAAEGGPLTVERVVQMLRAGKTSEEILPLIEPSGSALELTVDEVILLRKIGASVELIRAMAGAGAAPAEPTSTGPPAAGAKTVAGSLTVRDVLRELDKGADPAVLQQRIAAEGLKKPVEIHEIATLSATGVPADVVRSLARGKVEEKADPGEEPAAPDEESMSSEFVAIPAPPSAHMPTKDAADRLWIASVPSAARVYLASGRPRPENILEHAQYAGRTPLSLSLEPGDYVVIVEKEAGAFEGGLIPAWRTTHDTASSRSVLDEADLSFDPAACCLPGSLGGRALLRPLPPDAGRSLIGDAFDGLPPWLFDGEMLQVLRIRETRITRSLKMYRLRKNAAKPRMLVSLFVPAEGDPLDQSLAGLPAGTPYDAWVDAPGLEALRDPEQLADMSAALKVDRPHLEEAVAMLRRAGKAILHQQVEGGLRLVSLAVEDRGLMRLSESMLSPADPFAPPPPPPPKTKKRVKPLPEAPPLPEAARVVVPGLGAPRVTLHNSSSRGLGLLLDDGLFVWLAPGAQREAAVDPGTYDVRVLTAGASPEAPAPRGRLHLSYDARYTLTF